MALLHGSCPHGMILCLRASQTKIKGTDFDLSPLPRLIESYEQMAAYQRPARVLGIAVNTRDLDDMAAADAIARIQAETGLPAADTVRSQTGRQLLLDQILPILHGTLAKA
jgi:uncharacterized NAD-dependent epimerase/dehydratase family protein